MKSWDLDNLLFEMELRVFLKKKNWRGLIVLLYTLWD